MKVENAKITSTTLGVEDHGIFTAYIGLEGGGWGTSFGGFALDEPQRDGAGKFVKRIGCGFGAEWIKRLLETLEVEKWESLPGHFRSGCNRRGAVSAAPKTSGTSQKING